MLHPHVFWDPVEKNPLFLQRRCWLVRTTSWLVDRIPELEIWVWKVLEGPIARPFTLERGTQREHDSHKLLSSLGQEGWWADVGSTLEPFAPQLSLPAKTGAVWERLGSTHTISMRQGDSGHFHLVSHYKMMLKKASSTPAQNNLLGLEDDQKAMHIMTDFLLRVLSTY